MTAVYRLLLVLALLLVSLMSLPDARGDQNTLLTSLSWNTRNSSLPLLSLPDVLHGDINGLLAYPASEFRFPLSEPLSYDAKCDCYSLTVLPNSITTLRVVQLWRTPGGFYRSQNGPYVELETPSPLVTVTALDGTQYLFAEVGQGDRRCVSIHTRAGDYLLIDYSSSGLITRIRDSGVRTIVPTYQNGRITALTQTWTVKSARRTHTTVVASEKAY